MGRLDPHNDLSAILPLLIDGRKFEEVLNLLDEFTLDEVSLAPEYGHWKAVALGCTGQAEEALRWSTLLCMGVESAEANEFAARVWAMRGTIHYELSEFDQAELYTQKSFEWAVTSGNEVLRGLTQMNLGAFSILRRKWHEGLTMLNRALVLNVQLGQGFRVGGCHHNLGMAFRALGLPHKANEHFSAAARYFSIWGSLSDVATTEMEASLVSILTGDTEIGQEKARRVLDRAMTVVDPRFEGECRRVLGILHLWNGRNSCAELQFRKAARIARRFGNPLLRAEVEEARATLALRSGRIQEGLRRMDDAREQFAKMGIQSHLQPHLDSLVRDVITSDSRVAQLYKVSSARA